MSVKYSFAFALWFICQSGPAVKSMPVDPRVFLWLCITAKANLPGDF